MSFDKTMMRSNPNFKFKEIIRDKTEALGNHCQLDVFQKENDQVIMICANFDMQSNERDYHISLIDLSTNQEIKSIPSDQRIMSIRYFQDPKTKKNYFTTSNHKAKIAVYDLDDDCKCIFETETKYELFIYTNLMIFDEDKKYVVTSSIGSNNMTKVYNIDSKELKDLNSTKDLTVFYMEYWRNEKGAENEKHNIIHCAKNKVVVTSYPADKAYLTNEVGEEEPYIQAGCLFKKGGVDHFMFACTYGIVRILNLESKQQVYNITHTHGQVHFFGIIWWNEHYLLLNDMQQSRFTVFAIDDGFRKHGKILCPEMSILRKDPQNPKNILVELTNNKKMKKVIHPKYGECLITIGTDWKARLYVNRDIEAQDLE